MKRKNNRSVLKKPIELNFPHWGVLFYAGAAILLLPWTIFLSLELPTREVSHHWDLAWGGFDVFLTLMLGLTAYFLARRSIWVVATASALGTSLLVDAWFDVLTARQGINEIHSVILAIFVELPIAILSLYFAWTGINQNH